QLAASARRLLGPDGLAIVERLLRRGLDRDDPCVPLRLWWAVEARAMVDVEPLVALFGHRAAWEDPGLRDDALRLLRRYGAEGRRTGYDACLRLLASVPEGSASDALGALDRGLAERSVAPGGMGMAGLFAAAAVPEREGVPRRRFEPAPPEM